MAIPVDVATAFKPLSSSVFPFVATPLIRLWEEEARRSAAAVALEMGEEAWTYARLETRAQELADWLAGAGIAPGDRVGLCLERSPDMIAAVLAVLKRGAAYTPLDTSLPAARIAGMTADARLKGVMTTSLLHAQLGLATANPLFLDRAAGSGAGRPAVDMADAMPRPDDPMYILYTSGSTGAPKGVVMGKLPPSSLVQWQMAQHAGFGQLKTLQFTSLSFDVSVQEIFSTLCAGQTLVLADERTRRDGQALLRLIARHEVQRIFLPFVALQQLATAAGGLGVFPPSLKVILTAGEPLQITPALSRFFRALPSCRLVNQYGPTETHTVVSQYELPPGDPARWPASPPIGRALANAELYILDQRGRPVDAGQAGELCVGGRRVLAQGYWNKPELTAERFIAHPTSPGQRLYRTGDMARQDADGQIIHLGRLDDQVKIRGHRVELGEVEKCLRSLPGVDDAAVVAAKDASGASHLRGFFVSSRQLAPEELQDRLGAVLPEYMTPTVLRQLPELPLSTNNKVDRRLLAAWRPSEPKGDRWDNQRHQLAAEIWRRTLGLAQAAAEQNFFRMGGHSLLATRLLAELKQELGCDLGFGDLLANPTLGRLLERLDQATEQAEALPQARPDPANRHEPFPLTDVQQAYWLGRHDVFALGGVSTHLYLELENPDFEPARLERAWNQLIQRHDMLRAVIDHDGRQRILPQPSHYAIKVNDLRGMEHDRAEKAMEAVREELSHQVFDTAAWPLFEIRLSLFRGGARLHLSFDILILDALSQYILLDEWREFYQNPAWRPPELPDVSFRDYLLAEQRLKETTAYRKAADYWRERARSLPPAPALPLARAGENQPTAPRFERLRQLLAGPVWNNFRERAARAGVTPSAALLTAYAETLETWSKTDRFTLNLTLFNRLPLCPLVERLVGDFTSICLLEADFREERDFLGRTEALQQRLWSALDHRLMSGVEVLRLMRRENPASAAAGMPVIFTSALGLGAYDRDFQGYARMGRQVFGLTQTSQAWLDHQVWEQDGGLALVWDYRAGLFPPGVIEDMFRVYVERLLTLARDPLAWRRPWRDRLPQSQRTLLELVNATQAPLPTTALHHDFMIHAQANPEAPAVIFPGGRLSYRRLADLALIHAGALVSLGVGPGDRVIVAMRHGWEQVVAVLAASLVRAAYVPLNPDHPPARLAEIAGRLRAKALLSQPDLLDGLAWAGETPTAPVLDDHTAAPPDWASFGGHRPDDLAYIIFTSGSTGQPKGVAIEQLGAKNTIDDVNQRMKIDRQDRVLALSSLSFDLSVWDIHGPLAKGGALVLPESGRRKDPVAWVEMMERERVTIWNTVPALFQMLVEYVAGAARNAPGGLRLAMLSGDWLPVDLPGRARKLWPNLEVHGLGGATEASIWSICHLASDADAAQPSIPYGRPMTNQTFHVMDRHLRPCPVWRPGRLYIGGVGLAREYWRDPEKTAQAFIRVGDSQQQRLYDTGDWGLYLPDGDIRFLGRDDLQVKIAGHRIELGEIQSALETAPGVEQAQVVVADVGGTSLVGFVKPNGPCDQGAIRRRLAGLLPDYMRPAQVRIISHWPLGANGKVDRKALAELAAQNDAPPVEPTENAPLSGLEKTIAELWREVLGGRTPLRDESFYECGGDSLLATRLFLLLKKRFGERDGFSVVTVFEHPTVARQAEFFAADGRRSEDEHQARGARSRRMTMALGRERRGAG